MKCDGIETIKQIINQIPIRSRKRRLTEEWKTLNGV